ncbi:response regulator [Cohnella sp. CFH 77786]|uniref:response regulator transcription factor n=1 Tax=Cohnella sp. CFH 77786 TaxID=2662265 RepID=UPI001C60D672|nr:response regulator [Cohnella sp. CFH 77786]MBW5449415.1 response regulator [Cohnella sp. CFH 77786]
MEQMNILIVDDEVNTRQGIYYILERHYQGKHKLLTAEHGLEAYGIICANRIDLLLSDIRMPGMSGIDLLTRLHEEEKKDIAVLLLTGYADFEYAQQGIRLGILDYLLKPVDRDQLVRAVDQALEYRKASQRQRAIAKKWEAAHSSDGEAEGAEGVENQLIKKAIAFLNEHLDEENNVKEIAQHVHLSPSYFSVLFKEKTGHTFSEYVTKLRHRKAKELLLATATDINLIADQIGYRSSSYFIRVFKDIEGVTPRQYRDQANKQWQA